LATYVAAAALACGVGTASATVALFRMRDRPGLDALTYLHLSVGYVGCVVVVAWLGLGVLPLFMLLLGWQTFAVGVLLARFLGNRIGVGGNASLRWEALRAIPLLSAGDLASAVGVSVLYVELSWGADQRELSTFYVAAVLLTVAAMVWTYLLRLAQPTLVRRLASGKGHRDVSLGRRVASLSAATGIIVTVAAAAMAWWAGPDEMVLVAAVVVLEPLLYIGASLGLFVLENFDARSRRLAAAAAIPELVTVVVVGAALAPRWGATGALVAVCAGQTAKSAAAFAVLSSVDPAQAATAPRSVAQTSTAGGAAR
jgi:hypothetical protein